MKEDTSTTCGDTCCTTEPTVHTDTQERTLTTASPAWKADKDDEGVKLEISLPGVAKEDLDLAVQGHNLRLSARRRNGETKASLLVGHEAPDAYALKLRLGETLDGEGMTASLKDGLLKVAIPLAKEARSRSITIE